jgi:hypothetical protein
VSPKPTLAACSPESGHPSHRSALLRRRGPGCNLMYLIGGAFCKKTSTDLGLTS